LAVLFTWTVKVCRWPTARLALEGVSVTLIAAVKVTVALAEALGFALLLARTVTDPPAGKPIGAVYVVLLGSVCEFTIVPILVLPPTMPLTSQVTVASCAPVTTAWNACVLPRAAVAEDGDTVTLTIEITFTATAVAFDTSANGVAVICTVGGAGANDGAVYRPPEVIVPQAFPVQPGPETLQEITPLGLELAAGARVAVYPADVAAFMDAGPVTVSENELVIVIAAAPLFDGSATLIALMDALGGAVRTCGAV